MSDLGHRPLAGSTVPAVALGGASWSFSPSKAAASDETPDERGIAAIHAAIDCGVTMIDTARAYTTPDLLGHSEALIARAIAAHPKGDRVLVATKGGQYRDGDAFRIDGSRDAVRRHCETSIELLSLDRIWLYQLHWPDPNVPIAETMETFAELQIEGLVEHVGLSNVSVEQLAEARRVVDVVSVQNPFRPTEPSHWRVFEHCRGLGLPYLVYQPLRGLGRRGNGREATPLDLVSPMATRLAGERGVSIQRLLLAWLLSLAPTAVVIVGASRPETIRDAILAPTVSLTAEEANTIESELR